MCVLCVMCYVLCVMCYVLCVCVRIFWICKESAVTVQYLALVDVTKQGFCFMHCSALNFILHMAFLLI